VHPARVVLVAKGRTLLENVVKSSYNLVRTRGKQMT
jgi:hypothetical protein